MKNLITPILKNQNYRTINNKDNNISNSVLNFNDKFDSENIKSSDFINFTFRKLTNLNSKQDNHNYRVNPRSK